MAATKRTPAQIQIDRIKIAEMLLAGKQLTEIAQALGMTRQMVAYDRDKIFEEWRNTAIEDLDFYFKRELMIHEKLYREAMKGWEKSCQEAQKAKKVVYSGEGNKSTAVVLNERTEVSKEQTAGDSRFLYVAAQIRAKIIELLGLAKPQQIELLMRKEQPRTLKEAEEEIMLILKKAGKKIVEAKPTRN